MTVIHKKVWPEYFEEILAGRKKFELRLADFEACEGDMLVLEEWDQNKKEYTGRKTEVIVTYVIKTKGQAFWPQEDVDKYGFQVIQFEPKENREVLRPKVGVGVMIFKDGKILFARRRGAHGAGEYAFPGGHLEYMESFEDCARRETREECGIEIENIRFQFLANVIRYAPKHYVHIALTADWRDGKPQALEPEKSESWDWYDMDHLPEPMFAFCTLSVQSYKTGQKYFDVLIPDIRL